MPRGLNQTITRWTVTKSFGGSIYGAPDATYNGKYEEKREKFIGETGNEEISRAVVYLDKAVAVGDILFLGTSAEADPNNAGDVFEVRGYMEVPDMRNVRQERVAFL